MTSDQSDQKPTTTEHSSGKREGSMFGEGPGADPQIPRELGWLLMLLIALIIFSKSRTIAGVSLNPRTVLKRPPVQAEYLLYLILPKEERDAVIGDLNEEYDYILNRFDRSRADVWFYKQVICSFWPLLRRAVVRMGTLVWVGRLLRRLIS